MIHTSYGDIVVEIPRNRKGGFQSQVVKKYQNTVTQDMEEKIISMYAQGIITADIESHMRKLYDIEIKMEQFNTNIVIGRRVLNG